MTAQPSLNEFVAELCADRTEDQYFGSPHPTII